MPLEPISYLRILAIKYLVTGGIEPYLQAVWPGTLSLRYYIKYNIGRNIICGAFASDVYLKLDADGWIRTNDL